MIAEGDTGNFNYWYGRGTDQTELTPKQLKQTLAVKMVLSYQYSWLNISLGDKNIQGGWRKDSSFFCSYMKVMYRFSLNCLSIH